MARRAHVSACTLTSFHAYSRLPHSMRNALARVLVGHPWCIVVVCCCSHALRWFFKPIMTPACHASHAGIQHHMLASHAGVTFWHKVEFVCSLVVCVFPSAAAVCLDSNAEYVSGSCRCKAGYTLDNSVCTACAAGSYAAAGAAQCTQCPAGQYAASSGSATCTSCTGNTYSSTGATGCSSCPTNAVTIAGYTACQCSSGYEATSGTSFAYGNLTCTACTGNMYSTSGTPTCTACPENTTALNDNTGCACNSGCTGTWPGTCSNCPVT
jgi:hypothetical protein